MKRRICSLAVLFVFTLLCLGVTACDDRVRDITASSLFSDNTYELPVKPERAYATGGGTYFSVPLSLEQLQEKVDADPSVQTTTQLHGDFLLILRHADATHREPFCMYRANDTYFQIEMAHVIAEKDCLLYPIHLLIWQAEDTQNGRSLYVNVDEWYPTDADMEAFAAFYEQTGYFRVERQEDRLLIASSDPASLLSDRIASYRGSEFALEFKSEQGGTLVRCTVTKAPPTTL